MVVVNYIDNIMLVKADTTSTNNLLMNDFFLHTHTSIVLYACGIMCHDDA